MYTSNVGYRWVVYFLGYWLSSNMRCGMACRLYRACLRPCRSISNYPNTIYYNTSNFPKVFVDSNCHIPDTFLGLFNRWQNISFSSISQHHSPYMTSIKKSQASVSHVPYLTRNFSMSCQCPRAWSTSPGQPGGWSWTPLKKRTRGKRSSSPI